MKYVLFRNDPLRILFANGIGFQRPRRDESRDFWLFSSEEAARLLQKALRHDPDEGFVQIGKRVEIRRRMFVEFKQPERTET